MTLPAMPVMLTPEPGELQHYRLPVGMDSKSRDYVLCFQRDL